MGLPCGISIGFDELCKVHNYYGICYGICYATPLRYLLFEICGMSRTKPSNELRCKTMPCLTVAVVQVARVASHPVAVTVSFEKFNLGKWAQPVRLRTLTGHLEVETGRDSGIRDPETLEAPAP